MGRFISTSSLRESRFPKPKSAALWVVAASAWVLQACILGSPGEKEPEPDPDPDPITAEACADLNESQQRQGDSLVALAAALQAADIDYLAGGDVGGWGDVKTADPTAAITLYDKALEVAPGHCGALFGKAVARAMLLTQDPELENLAMKIEDEGLNKRGLLRQAPDRAAPLLLKTNATLRTLDEPTLAEIQSVAANVLLPRLDSAIAELEAVAAHDKFYFAYEIQGEELFIDNSTLGPGLAGLKVAKAFLLLVAGYDWDLSLDGSLDFVQTVEGIREKDYDNLSPDQKIALDHLTGLFKTSSPFSRMKPAYKTRIAAIPDLLLSAVEDVQSALLLAKSWGENGDPLAARRAYRVGTGEDADVDPADIDDAVELLERSKKYLKGEVPLSWSKGTRSLKVNFPALFRHEDGLQAWLPHFTIRPYAEWNDTLQADTSWTEVDPEFPSLYAWERPLKLALGYDEEDWDIGIVSLNPGEYQLEAYSYDDNSNYTETVLATLVQDETDPCLFHYQKEYDRVRAGNAYESVENLSEGSALASGCKVEDEMVSVVDYVDAVLKGPVYFTDPEGNLSFGPESLVEEEFEPNSVIDLQGRIYWRDPTFGGLFPDLTQENFWETLQSFEEIETRARLCEDVEVVYYTDPLTGEEYTDTERQCSFVKPENPSDLDLLVWVLSRPGELTQDAAELDIEF